MTGTLQLAREQEKRLQILRQALRQTPGSGEELFQRVLELQAGIDDILFTLEGPQAQASWEELPPMQMPLDRRLNVMIRTHWSSTSELTQTEKDQLEILKEEFPPVLERLEKTVGAIGEVEHSLEALKAPWTPGRVPQLD
jgi:hypothetical protein